MICKTCKHWGIIESHGSFKGDEGMKSHGYKNCLFNKKIGDRLAAFKFVHGNDKCPNHQNK